MKHEVTHLSDPQLLKELDGELSAHDEKIVRTHLEACWQCRTRRQELEAAICDFVHIYQQDVEPDPPSVIGQKALLKARLARLAEGEATGRAGWLFIQNLPGWAIPAAACALLVSLLMLAVSEISQQMKSGHQQIVVSSPNSRLTPGAAVLINRRDLCSQTGLNNKSVPEPLRRMVLGEYGIAEADLKAYEVDYLITPALGGADDIHNLWPQSYSSTVWNSRVKDALETRLHQMVCDGSLDLTTAQQDLAENWIATYKQYFHTDRPLQSEAP